MSCFLRQLRGSAQRLLRAGCLAWIPLLAGCGAGDPLITIQPFLDPTADLVVNGALSLTVGLNRPALRPLVVEGVVEAAYAQHLELKPTSLPFASAQQRTQVQVLAKAATDGRYATVTFAVVGDPESAQAWRVRIE